jgi:hypothetical protein
VASFLLSAGLVVALDVVAFSLTSFLGAVSIFVVAPFRVAGAAALLVVAVFTFSSLVRRSFSVFSVVPFRVVLLPLSGACPFLGLLLVVVGFDFTVRTPGLGFELFSFGGVSSSSATTASVVAGASVRTLSFVVPDLEMPASSLPTAASSTAVSATGFWASTGEESNEDNKEKMGAVKCISKK